jgi:hypothetical protein
MKKQIKKIRLNKKTISNLQPSEMNKKVAGNTGWGCLSKGCGGSKNGNTCYGHNTCA